MRSFIRSFPLASGSVLPRSANLISFPPLPCTTAALQLLLVRFKIRSIYHLTSPPFLFPFPFFPWPLIPVVLPPTPSPQLPLPFASPSSCSSQARRLLIARSCPKLLGPHGRSRPGISPTARLQSFIVRSSTVTTTIHDLRSQARRPTTPYEPSINHNT